MQKRWRLRLVVALWGASCVFGVGALASYTANAGAAPAARVVWPGDSAVPRATERPTLVLLAHPRCTCTRATLEELHKLVARHGDRVSVHVLFERPQGAPASFSDSDLYDAARRIPGADVRWDDEGREAARFGAYTSGTALLYGEDGALLFAGGLTGSRGHVGDNLGSARVASLLETGRADQATSDVYGCELARLDREAR
jgi:hypothetical protein